MNKFHILSIITLFASSILCFSMSHEAKFKTNCFRVFDGKEFHAVKSHDVDKQLRQMDAHQLHSFLASGCKIRALKLDNGDYVLRSFVPGLGGGPVLGVFTCIGAFTATGLATVGAGVGGFFVGGPAGAVAAAVVTVNAGVTASAYATAAAFAAPTP